MNKTISGYSEAGAFVIVPVKAGAVVTQLDQKRLGALQTWRQAKFTIVHFLAHRRAEVLSRIKDAKLSKRMRVIEITDKQWSTRGKTPETIPGTGICATAMQLGAEFVI